MVGTDDRAELGVPLVELLGQALVGVDARVGQPLLQLGVLGDQPVNGFEHRTEPLVSWDGRHKQRRPPHRVRGPALW